MSTEPRLSSEAPKPENRLTKRLQPQSIVYWSRLGFAVLAGAIFNLLDVPAQGLAVGALAAVGIGVLLYAASVFVVRYAFGYGPEVLAGARKDISIGMGSYIVWLIFTMILLNTILHPGPA